MHCLRIDMVGSSGEVVISHAFFGSTREMALDNAKAHIQQDADLALAYQQGEVEEQWMCNEECDCEQGETIEQGDLTC